MQKRTFEARARRRIAAAQQQLLVTIFRVQHARGEKKSLARLFLVCLGLIS